MDHLPEYQIKQITKEEIILLGIASIEEQT